MRIALSSDSGEAQDLPDVSNWLQNQKSTGSELYVDPVPKLIEMTPMSTMTPRSDDMEEKATVNHMIDMRNPNRGEVMDHEGRRSLHQHGFIYEDDSDDSESEGVGLSKNLEAQNSQTVVGLRKGTTPGYRMNVRRIKENNVIDKTQYI